MPEGFILSPSPIHGGRVPVRRVRGLSFSSMIKTIISSELPIDEQFRIQKNVIKNGTGTKRVCIVTGTHGDELEGQMVCYELVRIIKENINHLNGTVEIYPALNPLGIDTIQRGIPNFDLDMNRIFPGIKHGTLAEQAAYQIIEDLKGADRLSPIISVSISSGFTMPPPYSNPPLPTRSTPRAPHASWRKWASVSVSIAECASDSSQASSTS